MKTYGYKGMLRNRLPKVVDYALKWQKAKESWINHTYNQFIGIFFDKEERKKVTRIVLCLKYTHVGQGKNKHVKEEQLFDFNRSIDWENLEPEDTAYWERVSSWVDWFSKEYTNIEKLYSDSKKNGKDDFTIKVEIIQKFLNSLLPTENMTEEEKQAKYEYVDKLVDFLIKCFQHRIQ